MKATMTATKIKKTTKTIAGIRITLTSGRRYQAARPIAHRFATEFVVTIRDITDAAPGSVAFQTPLMDRADADALINGFNNGETSFAGRLW